MSSLSLLPTLQQELKLTPQLLQSMEILQMNSQELLDYLNKAYEDNPIIEKEDPSSLQAAYAELRQKASWIDSGSTAASFTHDATNAPEQGVYDAEPNSLAFFLKDQLERLHLPKQQLALSKYMADMVDEDGYLPEEDLDGLYQMHLPADMVEQALLTLQSLEPAGVAARNLSECLALQLQRLDPVDTIALQIVKDYLPELSRKHYGPICRELGLSLAQVTAAAAIIATLDPHPGQAFQPEETTNYIQPDVFVIEDEGTLRIILNEYYLPKVSINSYYARLLKETGEDETKEYLRQKMQQAKWLLSSLDRRGNTLQHCAEAVLDVQRAFFSDQTTQLQPMSLSDLASKLSLHPSTISRAVRGKYLQCRQGTFPMRYFFSRAVGGSSRQALKLQLLELVRQEDPTHPLSDQQLCLHLSSETVQIARRTVAKYRTELGIPSSSARRQRDC